MSGEDLDHMSAADLDQTISKASIFYQGRLDVPLYRKLQLHFLFVRRHELARHFLMRCYYPARFHWHIRRSGQRLFVRFAMMNRLNFSDNAIHKQI